MITIIVGKPNIIDDYIKNKNIKVDKYDIIHDIHYTEYELFIKLLDYKTNYIFTTQSYEIIKAFNKYRNDIELIRVEEKNSNNELIGGIKYNYDIIYFSKEEINTFIDNNFEIR